MQRLLLFLLLMLAPLQGLILEDLDPQIFENKKVGFYTGSFDPLHRGHEGFVRKVIEKEYCDYVLVLPAWGNDKYKQRAPISYRLDMIFARFADDPKVVVSRLSPLEVQQKLTRPLPNTFIRNYPVVAPFSPTVEFIGLIGSDTARNLVIPFSKKEEEVDRQKRLQVFMRGVAIPERHAKTTIGSIMAIPVSQFIVGVREGDDLTPLEGMVSDRPILTTIEHAPGSGASSTLVKQRIKAGESTEDLIAPEVATIIHSYHLYSQSTDPNDE